MVLGTSGDSFFGIQHVFLFSIGGSTKTEKEQVTASPLKARLLLV